MKSKSFTLAIIILLIDNTINQVLDPRHYAKEGEKFSDLIRISVKVQKEVKDASETDRADYINSVFSSLGNGGITLYEGTFTDVTSKFDVTYTANEFLAKKQATFVYNIKPKESTEHIEGWMTLAGKSYNDFKDGTSTSTTDPVTSVNDSNGEEIFIKARWIANRNIQKLFKIFFTILKFFFNIVMILITLGRPFMPIWMQMRAAWIGQSVILFQLTTYAGLTPGTFGGLIDDCFAGMIESSRKYFLIKIMPGFRKEQGFVFYEYYQNNLRSYLLEECFLEVIFVLVISVAAFVLKLTSREDRGQTKIVRIVRTWLSSIYIFTFTPVVVFFVTSLFTFGLIKDRSLFTILDVLIGSIVMIFYSIQVGNMIRGINTIKHLHSVHAYDDGKVIVEQGLDWAFDTFVCKETKSPVRVFEFFLYAILAGIWGLGYLGGVFSVFAIVVIYCMLLTLTVSRHRAHDTGTNEREEQKSVINLTLVHLILKMVEYMLLMIFWILPKMTLSQVKVLTWVYLVVFLINIFLLFIQILLRLVNLTTKPEYYEERVKIFNVDPEDPYGENRANDYKDDGFYDDNEGIELRPDDRRRETQTFD